MTETPGITEIPDRRRFQGDVMWNIGGLAISAIAGILLHFFIGTRYGAAPLGVFNQVFAVFIFSSQLATLGVHHSLLKYASSAATEDEVRHANTAALTIAMVLGVLTSAAVAALAGPIAGLLESPGVERGLYLACPGLFFFAVNKVTLAHLNAMHRMRPFAVFQAGRFVLMLGGFLACLIFDVGGDNLAVVLSVGEGGVFVLSIGTLLQRLAAPHSAAVREWMGRHLDFGLRGFMSGMLIELNTRVDVLMLGVFANDALVGVYSFAAIFAEGMYQLLVVARSNYNPVLAKLLAGGKKKELAALIRRGRNTVYPLMIGAVGLAVLAYWGVVPLVTSVPELQESWILFAILAGGIALGSGFTPFNQILLQAGKPGWHTMVTVLVVAFNAAANYLLISSYGAHGAAIATAAAFVFAALVLVVATRRLIGVAI